MKALVAVEAFKLRKRPMAWILLVFGPLLVVLVYVMLLAISVASSAAVDARSAAEFRAALAFDDPLLVALGRSSREQVVTHRDGIATTLQALELTNGITLDAKLKAGAERWLARSGKDPEALVGLLWLNAFGRAPTTPERDSALELTGRPATVEGLQDLLWSITMLPEFQLVP